MGGHLTRLMVLLAVLTLPSAASAHAFGQSYQLPIPFGFYLVAAAIVLVFTFFSMAFLFNEPRAPKPRTISVGTVPFPIRAILSVVALAILLLTIATGLFGNSNALRNFATTFFWVITWAGLPVTALIIGGLWESLNPLVAIGRLADKHLKTRPYPADLGLWPALAAYMVFVWFELVPGNGYEPRTTAILLVLYVASLLIGAAIYGSVYVRQADFFTVLTRLLGAVSPLGWHGGRVTLRAPGAGLHDLVTTTPGLVAFIVFFISGVSFDGFKETLVWQARFTGFS